MEIELNLHPAGHECAPGSLDCGIFGESFYGIRASDRRYVTFAVGSGKYNSVMIYREGKISEEEFRNDGTYQVALLNKSPHCLHKMVFGQVVHYAFSEVERGPLPLHDTQLPAGEISYINMEDPLCQ